MAVDADALSPAIEDLLKRYATMVRNVAAGRGLPESDVDEVFQEVRIRLWRAMERRENPSDLPASYVYRTAMSAALDLIRRRRARREEELGVMHGGETGAAPDPERDLEADELARTVAEAVEALTPSRRPVVRMHLAGYHRTEIAELLGWSEAKTRNLIYRGLAELRARLAERGVEPQEV
jgi:RNA polymerase sigma-70 factor (ECF subfamily)